ncbi:MULTISPECIES: hypothetical protein [unclassified Streptomyces]|uniref:hypothetical protein n=1 Tax=unclassified Streptomyces TaxID=2593676 RepID=UPI0037F67ABE
MASSEARWVLGRLTEAFGVNGVLMARKEPGSNGPEGQSKEPEVPQWAEGGDLPGAALRWPPCECGGPKCPDSAPEEPLNQRLAERNRRSSRGGV